MLDLEWDALGERYYEYGLDRGALYFGSAPPIPWNGITGFEESTEAGATSVLYRDGRIYLAEVDASDFSGSLTALFYPQEFSEYVGIAKASDGLYVDNQKPKRFSFSYRTLVGSGAIDDLFGHQIHLVYNAVASIGTRSRKTMTENQELTEFNFDIACTPVQLPGHRPTSHYIIDTRGMDRYRVDYIEAILYGGRYDVITEPITDSFYTYGPPGRLPNVTELINIVTWASDGLSEPITQSFPA